MLVRACVLLAAAIAVAFGIAGLRQTHRCDAAERDMNVAIYEKALRVRGAAPPAQVASAQRRMIASCRDRTDLARYATNEGTVGLTASATALARKVTELEPRNRFGWLALALVLGPNHPAAAAVARRRAHALDPRGVPLG